MKAMRTSTLETLGLGSVIDMFQKGQMPTTAAEQVDRVFGPSNDRGSMVISGANGIVGAGKMMQLGSRLVPFGVTMVGLDFATAADGLTQQIQGLVDTFGKERADQITAGIVRLNYDGRSLPSKLADMKPKFLLEAIPEILDVKKAHYEVFRASFPDIDIRSVTSGFPSSELGVGIAHPAFPHQINKIWEVVEQTESDFTKLLWALGLIPMPVSDHWSFVLDVLFCGLTLAGLRYHGATNMPYWKIDKYVRRLIGANPFRAHDAIGAAGANFLTWSCLHHLAKQYGPLFAPTDDLNYRRESGQNWYPLDHLRPIVNWSLAEGDDEEEFQAWMLGPMIQMTSLLLHENRSHLSHINAIGEQCAQFRSGMLATIRKLGPDRARQIVEAYHRLHPEAATSCWYPDTMNVVESMPGQQLYINAEHDGKVGVITLSRESYNSDVDAELNRAIDWLKNGGIDHVIVTGDFHLSTQMVGADTSDFYPALSNAEQGVDISSSWSRTARRLDSEFATSVGLINGKRCLGGMLELLMHCHYLLAVDSSSLGMPEVTLPVIPGMEGCHWPYRKASSKDWPRVTHMLLGGQPMRAPKTVGWLIDFAGPIDECLKTAWQIATGGNHSLKPRSLVTDALNIESINSAVQLSAASDADVETARKAIIDCIQQSCSVPMSEALAVQAKHSGNFMAGKICNKGVIGSEAAKVLKV